MVNLNAVLLVSFLLFSIGIAGVLIRRNALVILMCVELMLNAANLNFIAFWRYSPTSSPATGANHENSHRSSLFSTRIISAVIIVRP